MVCVDGQPVVIVGARHHDFIMRKVYNALDVNPSKAEQGFIDNYGCYHTREDAYVIADEAGQIDYDRNGCKHRLYSEGLY